MDLVLFEDAMRHVTKITRIISQPSGHVLLVGVGGSGKQSLARLASHICTYSTFQITISQTYGMNELKKNLSTLYTKSGMKEEGILFFFTDGQITSERFLVYTDDLLSSGEVADLYAPEDKDNIINQIRAKVKSAGVQDSCGNCWNYYIDRVKVQSSHGSLLLTCR
jgi:dynein heavy chain